MSKRDAKLLVADILESIAKIKLYTQSHTFETFTADSKTIDAVIRNFEVIGEAANRLPAMAGIEIIRFNTRGTTSEAGTSAGSCGEGVTERFDVEAAIEFSFKELGAQTLWVMGWSFGTDLALKFARDPRVAGLILLSPPLRTSEPSDLEFWAKDGRPIIALIPEFDDYLQPEAAAQAFKVIPQIELINVDEAKHLWVGEPAVYRVLSEITRVIAPEKLPLPIEI